MIHHKNPSISVLLKSYSKYMDSLCTEDPWWFYVCVLGNSPVKFSTCAWFCKQLSMLSGGISTPTPPYHGRCRWRQSFPELRGSHWATTKGRTPRALSMVKRHEQAGVALDRPHRAGLWGRRPWHVGWRSRKRRGELCTSQADNGLKC